MCADTHREKGGLPLLSPPAPDSIQAALAAFFMTCNNFTDPYMPL